MKYSHFALFLILSTLCSSIFFNGGSPAAEAAGISSIISRAVFDEMLKHRNDTSCRSEKFYTYEAFVTAAKSFEGFGTTGNLNTRKREIAAFLGQTSKQTAVLKCFCSNQEYGRAGRGIGVNLINNPDLVETDAVISFKTAIWFWMTPQTTKPSSHDVITGKWKPTSADRAAKRLPGYGVIINIISGSACGWGTNDGVADRIGFYKRYCDILGVGYGKNLDCYFQTREQCGRQAGNALCPNNLCCSQYGWCGTTEDYCGNGCQSQCKTPPSGPTPSGGSDIGSIITPALFDQMLKYRNDGRCPSNGFYSYNAFITAARSFNGFGTTGDLTFRKREIAAFLAQTSHETTGGWGSAPDGPYAWGYCFIRERNPSGNYCSSSAWPCPPGRQYYGRGPIQLTHNYNYGQAGQALGVDLINNPDLVATDAVISFKTAIWFWMTPQGNKPSSHVVAVGRWTPSDADRAARRSPGYGVITNIINGGLECGQGPNAAGTDRIGFYKRYCDMLGVDYGINLDCYNQSPFA
ncbi:hypothetical protein M9H77_05273 [Catharanthus roseus]|uniref:Uncharacterized protein n=1 Tax=Catharanthus roseus TaxID=4058 RepID=A0ACC0CGM6_CATRO|nr:hypothetical protein M9H77_05273 [Catharanthus roseus]